MTSVLSSGAGTISTALTSITSSSIPSVDATRKHSSSHLTPAEIAEVVIGSIVFCLLVALMLIFVLVIRRSRPKYQHPEDGSKTVDTDESATGVSVSTSQDNRHSTSEQGGTVPLTTQTQQNLDTSLVTSDSRYFKDAYTRPSSFVNEGLPIHETYAVSSGSAQSPGDTEPHRGFEPVTLLSAPPSSLKSAMKLAPLSIPEPTLNHSNGKRSNMRKGSKQSSKTPDSSAETDDSTSLYSEASANSSKSYIGTLIPPSVPPIPLRFMTSTQSILPESIDVIVDARRQEEAIIKCSPTTSLFAPLPPLRINRDEAGEDDTEVYNVAKLLHLRQSRLQKAPIPLSRNSSIVSHIERSGSIKAVVPAAGEEESESNRPRYYRLKQNRSTRSSYTSTTHLRDSFVFMLSSSHSQDSKVVGS